MFYLHSLDIIRVVNFLVLVHNDVTSLRPDDGNVSFLCLLDCHSVLQVLKKLRNKAVVPVLKYYADWKLIVFVLFV